MRQLDNALFQKAEVAYFLLSQPHHGEVFTLSKAEGFQLLFHLYDIFTSCVVELYS